MIAIIPRPALMSVMALIPPGLRSELGAADETADLFRHFIQLTLVW